MTVMQRLGNIVRIGIAEGAIAHPPDRLRTTGLGSCVGLVVYDTEAGLAGMVHIMLPTSGAFENIVPTKYADLGVPWLVENLIQQGCHLARLKAKFAGGAQMFPFVGKSETMRVGPRNTEAVEAALLNCHIPIVSKDVGGNVGRTIEFDLSTEALSIKTALLGTYYI